MSMFDLRINDRNGKEELLFLGQALENKTNYEHEFVPVLKYF
jgi:hypothetical protein